jgi:chemotaxis protein MotB
MSGANHNRRRRGDHGGGHDGGMERWLLTYSDMITLLMALFIIMWAVSSVNQSKFSALKASLTQAFHGKIQEGGAGVLTAGRSPLESAGTQVPNVAATSPTEIVQQIATQISSAAAHAEAESLKRLQERIDAYARRHGLAKQLTTAIDERGLVVHVLTDQLLFDTGQAVLEPSSRPLLRQLSALLAHEKIPNPIRVEGNTDDVPISTSVYRSNWELSAARAAAVLEQLATDGVPQTRLSLAGYADERPVATNLTAAGRAANRRVDLVVLRRDVQGDSLP